MRSSPTRVVWGLVIATSIAAGCGRDLPSTPLAQIDPVPMTDDLASQLDRNLSKDGSRLQPPDTTPATVSADRAREIAARDLQQYLAKNDAPALDASHPDGLVRRSLVASSDAPSNIWVVVYRYAFDCQGDASGPSPCPATTYYLIDDRTGEIVYRVSNS